MSEVIEPKDDGTDLEQLGERGATKATWAKELQLAVKLLHDQLKGLIGIDGKTSRGKVLFGAFYAESVVRQALADVLVLPRADENDHIISAGTNYARAATWARELGILEATIQKRVKKIEGIKGITRGGTVGRYHSESTIRERCVNAIWDKTLRVPPSGEITLENVLCLGLKRFSKAHGLDDKLLHEVVSARKLPVLGYALSGKNKTALYERDRIIFDERVQKKLVENGIYLIENEWWVLLKRYAKSKHVSIGRMRKEMHEKHPGIHTKEIEINRRVQTLFPKDQTDLLIATRAPKPKKLRIRNGNKWQTYATAAEVERITGKNHSIIRRYGLSQRVPTLQRDGVTYYQVEACKAIAVTS
jgi:hypothetical protein